MLVREIPLWGISKIENKKGFENCREICTQSDSLLIDRGDMSREFKMEDIPEIQKKIIRITKNNIIIELNTIALE